MGLKQGPGSSAFSTAASSAAAAAAAAALPCHIIDAFQVLYNNINKGHQLSLICFGAWLAWCSCLCCCW
jgi:hypothetical protein